MDGETEVKTTSSWTNAVGFSINLDERYRQAQNAYIIATRNGEFIRPAFHHCDVIVMMLAGYLEGKQLKDLLDCCDQANRWTETYAKNETGKQYRKQALDKLNALLYKISITAVETKLFPQKVKPMTLEKTLNSMTKGSPQRD